jgi:hypothetical protein
MRTKKYLIAIAIFGGIMFTAQAVNAFSLDGATTVKVDKTKVKR